MKDEKQADLLLFNAYIYPVSAEAINSGAVVIRDGKIVQVGSSEELVKEWEDRVNEKIDCEGKFLMPGFIDGHAHFSGLGRQLRRLDLLETKSWDEIVDSVKVRVMDANPGEWIIGRGWHQEKWNETVEPNIKGYPFNTSLNQVSPNNPVILEHASGHMLMANEAAMKAARISNETPNPTGGVIIRDNSGRAIGVFEENSMNIIDDAYKEYQKTLTEEHRKSELLKAIEAVQQHCLQYGITTFEDAGSTFEEVRIYHELAVADELQIRLWAMLYEPYDKMTGKLEAAKLMRRGNDMFTCNAIKTYIDGALGSYGAWLLEPYSDQPTTSGQIVTSIDTIKMIAALSMENDMQFCVHAIGDKGNRTVLDIMEAELKKFPEKTDLRWRIEHAQHIDPQDIPRFKALGVIASVQAIHCTSDAPFVEKRLGEKRARESSYPWRALLDAGAAVANGTDAPVERINPFPNLYASVTRRRPDTGQVFYKEQAMTRAEALYSYTLANAYAAKEEDIKGSLEQGKWADIILVSENLFTCPEENLLKAQVEMTMVGGQIKFKR